MDISVSQEQGRVPVTVLHISGELTADTASVFEAAATRAIEGGAQNLLLDLTDVPFIGSFGIRALNRVLVALYEANGLQDDDARKVLRTGGKALFLKLLNPTRAVLNVLETSGFDMLLEVRQGLAEAVASY